MAAAEEPGLAEVMRRRREGCEELESTPIASTADAAAAAESSASQDPAATVFESAPRGSIADAAAAADVCVQAAAATSWESAPQVSVADVSAAATSPTPESPTATSWESAPQASVADVSAAGSSATIVESVAPTVFESTPGIQTADVTASVSKTPTLVTTDPDQDMAKTRSMARSDQDLSSILQERAARCEVLESTPLSSTTDVQATVVPSVSYPATGPKVRTDIDLQRWMSKMQGRVSVIQSQAELSSAMDQNGSEQRTGDKTAAATQETDDHCPQPEAAGMSLPAVTDVEGEAASVVSIDQADTAQSNCEKRNSVDSRYDALGMAVSLPDLLEQLQRGEPLNPTQRERIWPEWLHVQASQCEGDAGDGGVPPAIFALLQRAQSRGDRNEDLTPSSSVANGASTGQLAAAFVSRRLPWLANGEEGSIRFFENLAKMLRYHCPSTAHTIETIADMSGAQNLAGVLSTALGGSQGITDLLFASPAGSDSEDALLVLCDFAVLEEEGSLLLFVLIWLVAVSSLEPEYSFEQLSAKLRGEALGGLVARGPLGVSQTVSGARAFLEATPASIREVGSVLSADVTACAVSAEEVAHHVYGRPTGTWRLVVVDVRTGEAPLALPVCMRLDTLQDRREVLLDLPYEEAIHLVLLGDGSPTSGDEALELYQYLTQPPARRRHLAVVAGGWPAVEACVRSQGMDFVQMEVKTKTAGAGDSGQDGLAAAGQKVAASAAEKAAEIQKQAAVAGKKAAAAAETAAKAGEKAGRKLWKGMNRLVDRLDQHFATTEAAVASSSAGGHAASEASHIQEKEGERRVVL